MRDISVTMVGRFVDVLVAPGRRGRRLLQYESPSSFPLFFFSLLASSHLPILFILPSITDKLFYLYCYVLSICYL